ncbi:hypothetical protein [Phycicoccus avicenniae]
MERALRLVDWLALTKQGQHTALAAQCVGAALAVTLPLIGRRFRGTPVR